MRTVQLLVKGRVQGVFYRATAKEKAEELGIKGWVRNTAEGYVEILANGTEEQLKKFIDWCYEGPPKAEVDEVLIQSSEDQVKTGFHIVR